MRRSGKSGADNERTRPLSNSMSTFDGRNGIRELFVLNKKKQETARVRSEEPLMETAKVETLGPVKQIAKERAPKPLKNLLKGG